jgi:hypothetical protein
VAKDEKLPSGSESTKTSTSHGRSDKVAGWDPRSILAPAALIGAGLLIEPELLGGALLGAGVVYGWPLIGRVLRPMVKTALEVGYSAATSVNELVSDAGQSIQDVIAEVRSGHQRSEGPTSTATH